MKSSPAVVRKPVIRKITSAVDCVSPGEYTLSLRLHSAKSLLPLPTKCFLWCRVWRSFLFKFFEAPVIIIWFSCLSFNVMKCPLITFMLCVVYRVLNELMILVLKTKLHHINYISNYIHFISAFVRVQRSKFECFLQPSQWWTASSYSE